VWDRSSSSPAPAAAAEAPAALLISPSTPIAHAAKPVTETSSIGARLIELAAAQNIDPAQGGSAFTLPETWPTVRKVEIAPAATRPAQIDLDRLASEDFIHKHHLDAVMVRAVNNEAGIAIVDGQSVTVGHTFDRFKLVSVSKTTAVFRRGRVQMEMRLAAASKLKRDGATIADSAATPEE
jgi:hypothetical protein